MASTNNYWRKVKLGSFCKIIMGQSPPSSTYNIEGKGLPFFQGVKDFGRIYPSKRVYCTANTQKIAEAGDVLLSVRAPVGEVNIAPEKCIIGRGIAALRVITGDKYDQRFLYYLMLFNKKIWKRFQSGTTFEEITYEDIKNLEVFIPEDILERHRIAEILGSLDDKIELNYEMNKTLEAIAQAIFENWFVNFEPFKDELVYSKELDKKIPKEWEIKPISEVVHVNPPRKLRKGIVTRKISMSDLKPWQSWIESWSYEEYKGGPTFQNGDTLFARISPSLENGKTALVLILDEGEIAFGTTEFIVLAPKVIKSDYYVFCLARTRDVREKAIRAMSGSSGRQRVPVDIFDRILIPVPPEEVIKEFDKLASPLFEMIKVNAKENLVLARIRDALLPKLLSGEIRVKVDVEKEFPEETRKLEEIKEKKAKIQVSLEKWLKNG
jgi:Restriction endonuclease S subunits